MVSYKDKNNTRKSMNNPFSSPNARGQGRMKNLEGAEMNKEDDTLPTKMPK